jgi:LEA14-like dessication related protein
MRMIYWFSVISFLVLSCAPKEQVVFRAVNNLVVDAGLDGEPVLRGDAVFYNPNKMQTKLKEINVSVLVDDKNAAVSNQSMDLLVPRQSEFTVPLEVKLSLKEFTLMDAVIGLLGGKTYKIKMVGFIRVKVHGLTVKVPVKYSEEVKLR